MEARISGTTKLFGLIGSPVSHSASPAMQNYGFQACGVDGAYLAFDIKGNISERVETEIIQLAKEHGIQKVILFGSRARGDNWERSDIDLAVSGGDIPRFALDLDEEVWTLLLFDVVNLDEPVQPSLLEEIARDGVVIYEHEKV